jgi:hypothetical protein
MDAEASAHQLHGRGRDPQHSSSLRLRHVEVPGERGGPLPFSLFGLGKAANDSELQGKEANDLERMMSDPIGFILGIGTTKEVKKHDFVMCEVHCLYVETRTRINLYFSLSLSLSLSPYKNVRVDSLRTNRPMRTYHNSHRSRLIAKKNNDEI